MNAKIIRPAEFRRTYQEKPVVFIAVPSHRGLLTVGLAFAFSDAGLLSFKPEHPYAYAPFVSMAQRPIEYARNKCVEAFLEFPRARRILFIDDDMVPPRDWWRLLLHDEPIVSGFTVGWQGSRPAEGRPASPLFVSYWKGSDGKWESKPPPSYDKAFYADGVGAACLVIDREVLEKMGPPWFETRYDPKDGHVLVGEDLCFFEKANALGYRVLINPTIQFGHEKTIDALDVGRYGLMAMEDGRRVGQVPLAH